MPLFDLCGKSQGKLGQRLLFYCHCFPFTFWSHFKSKILNLIPALCSNSRISDFKRCSISRDGFVTEKTH